MPKHRNHYFVRCDLKKFQKTHSFEDNTKTWIPIPLPLPPRSRFDDLEDKIDALHTKFDSFLDAVRPLQEVKKDNAE